MKSNETKNVIFNAKIAIAAQIVTLIIGFVKSLIIPGLLSIEEYGYWQIYLLYLPYIGLFYWGFNDGIYLKYGGYTTEELPYEKIRSSIKLFFIMLILESTILSIILLYLSKGQELIALLFVVLNISIQGIYGTMIYILQVTNRIKEFSFFSIIDKLFFVIYLLIFVFNSHRNYISLMLADVFSRLIITIIMIVFNKELFIGKHASLLIGFKEFTNNIGIGISLMLASFISMLFTGCGKIFIANCGDIENYAYYSFGMSLINLLLVCFTSISTVMYPILKKMNKNSISKQYNMLNSYFEVICSVGMFSYFLCYFFINTIYVKYTPVLGYLNILFVLAIFQGKITLLNNTYYKVLREEKRMLFDNVISLIIFIILCFFFCDSTKKVAILTCLVMMHRSIGSEWYLRDKMSNRNEINLLSLFSIIIFFLIGTSINVYVGLVVYIVFFALYVLKKKEMFYGIIKMILLKNN